MNELTDIPVLTEMRRSLVAGIRRSARPAAPRPAARRIALAAATAATAAGVVAAALAVSLSWMAVGPSAPRPAAAFTVRVEHDGRIHVRMHQGFDQASRLADELRSAGVDVRVLPRSADPVLVGMVEFPSHQLDEVGVELGTREFWIDPDRFDGQIEMLVYVAAEPGEVWQQAPSVFHPDEPLGGLPCALDGPLTTDELQRRARSVGIDRFSWTILQAPDANGSMFGYPAHVGETDPAPVGQVLEAHRLGPDRLEVSVMPPEVVAEVGPTPTPTMSLNLDQAPEPACTADLRDRWTGE
jgi:hypothetical protein